MFRYFAGAGAASLYGGAEDDAPSGGTGRLCSGCGFCRLSLGIGRLLPSPLDLHAYASGVAHDLLEAGLGKVLEKIVQEVEATNPSLVVVDSFRSVIRASDQGNIQLSIHAFVQRLALYLTSWQATTFLVGEYMEAEKEDNPIFTVADGVLWLY